MASYTIKLPQFEGPFDLLLFFIERDELELLRARDLQNVAHMVGDIFPSRNETGGQLCTDTYGQYFSIEAARAIVKCPEPFVKNERADMASVVTNQGVHSKFCVKPCPSFIYR